MMSDDLLIYLGDVAKWIKDAPGGKFGYGNFAVTTVEVCFDGDFIGNFYYEGPGWIWREKDDRQTT